jgi:hypothetical protein
MHQQLWGYKVEEKLHQGLCEQKKKDLIPWSREGGSVDD